MLKKSYNHFFFQLREEALQRELHTTRKALIKQVCHSCNHNEGDKQDDAVSFSYRVNISNLIQKMWWKIKTHTLIDFCQRFVINYCNIFRAAFHKAFQLILYFEAKLHTRKTRDIKQYDLHTPLKTTNVALRRSHFLTKRWQKEASS